ncbi:hypothetical protein IL54_1660 [Sphingobium sp. ba1]|nr:hypothetical protein IL54_1660 [Sphingobium sp. ba1]
MLVIPRASILFISQPTPCSPVTDSRKFLSAVISVASRLAGNAVSIVVGARVIRRA